MKGFTGKILHVDLTEPRLWIETPEEVFYREYIGGSAMGMYYILKDTRAGVDPLGPENVLTMMLSAATGTPISGQSRMCANARSPLVDGIGDAQCGGVFPAEMKFAGFDGLVIQGRADSPKYLWLHDGTVELRDASHLWGKTTSQVDDILKEELNDPKIEIAQCGPAGENLVKLAAIINMGNRANGRTGLGAVMGSKNLKAVVVRGSKRQVPVANAKKINEMARAGVKFLPQNPDVNGLRELGTAGVLSFQQMTGTLPTYNYNMGQFEHFDGISGETLKETILKENDTCFACTVRCKRVVETEWMGKAVEGKHGGPEYETLGTFGSYCGISSIQAVAYANQLCNEYGLDTIGTGATIAWTMECFENGVLSEAEIGFPAPYGDETAMIRLVEMMTRREGFGDVLAEGSRKAADRLGKGHQYLITAKGAEAPAHMPQAKRTLGLIYAVNPFGADHQSHEHDPAIEEGASDLCMQRLGELGFTHTLAPKSMDREKIDFALKTQIFYSFLDSAALCQFVWGPAWHLFGPNDAVELIQAVTGWEDFSLDELMALGKKRLTMMRRFNAREGLGRDEDTLPDKFFKPLQGTGPTAGVAVDRQELETWKDIYYELLGWDVKTGLPV